MLSDFIRKRRAVQAGGLRFVCHAPTVATVHTVLQLYGGEIATVLDAAERTGTGFSPNLTREILNNLIRGDDPRVTAVLDTCVDGVDQLTDPPSKAMALQLMETVCDLCDPERIIDSLNLGLRDEEPISGPSDGPGDEEIAILRLALDIGCSPMEIMQWPYETVLAVLDIFPLLKPDRPGTISSDYKDETPNIPGFGVLDAGIH